MTLGIRVVRGPDWNLGDRDGGPNHAGTVTTVLDGDCVKVQWDMGSNTVCRAGQSGQHDLVAFDTAPVGIRHPGVLCDECDEQDVRGIRWKCAVCEDYDLCTPCYLEDSHITTHTFIRIDYPGASPVKITKRSISQRQRVMGMFPNSEVVRGPDWDRTSEDGGKGNVGTVEENVSFKKGELQRDAVSVKWPNGDTFVYRVGFRGHVDLICTEEAPGPDYYPDHLPTVDVASLKAMINIDKPCVKINVGDKVCVDMTKTEFESVQKRRLHWNQAMEELLGQVVTIDKVTTNGDYVVDYNGLTVIIDKNAITKVPTFKKRDNVRVIDSIDRVKQLQHNHGGWTDGMTQFLGRLGTVTVTDSDGDVAVSFGDADYVFHPLCLLLVSPTEGASNLMSDDADIESDIEVETSNEGMAKAETDSDSDDALDLIKGLAGLLMLQTLALRSDSDVKVDFVKAVIAGDEQNVKDMLKRQPGLKNITYEEIPCFIIAAIKEHYGVVKVMLEARMDIDTQDAKGNTALMISMSKENNSISKLLVLHGADMNMTNIIKQTALHIAVRSKFVEGVKLLLAAGADINIQDSSGDTPLHDAIEREHDVIAALLVQRPGLNVWLKNKKEFTTLAFACFKPHAASVNALISKEPKLGNSFRGLAGGGSYPMHIAAINNHVTEAKILLQKATVDVNAVNMNKQSSLHLAANAGYFNMVELLLKSGADHSLKDVEGNTALHLSLQGKRSENMFLQLLGLRHDGEINERIKTADLLVQNGANTAARNSSGETPLDVCTNPRIRREVETIILKKRQTSRPVPSLGTFLLQGLFSRKCRRCSTSTADTRFIPCNHSVACQRCCHSYNRCPVCNSLVLKVALK